MITAASDWTILVPLKSTTRGKSRLDVSADLRQRLALAMALDTVSAAAACGAVVAVVDDETDAAALAGISGVRVHLTSVSGLNESIRDGLKALSGLSGQPSTSGAGQTANVAVLPGDLPSLQPEELGQVLERCARHRYSVVADHQGVGTTLLAATELGALDPQYGPDSYRRHRAAGAAAIELPTGSSLRWDVDVVVDLGAISGSFTRGALAAFTPEG